MLLQVQANTKGSDKASPTGGQLNMRWMQLLRWKREFSDEMSKTIPKWRVERLLVQVAWDSEKVIISSTTEKRQNIKWLQLLLQVKSFYASNQSPMWFRRWWRHDANPSLPSCGGGYAGRGSSSTSCPGGWGCLHIYRVIFTKFQITITNE